ncbi:MAG: ThiF family adenylyltransferase [Tepidisphaeraceae bacterium]|jgi:molybdopterin/thiamine biosynthesis adenylyltransferase
MAGKLRHEETYRGREQIARLSDFRIALCGAGALGSNLADNLARQGFGRLRVIDHDCVEEHNVSTQLYGEAEVGLWKVEALRNRIFRNVGIEIEAVRKQLTPDNAHILLKDVDLIIDTFDNSASRGLVQERCRRQTTPCLHVGLAADYCEIVWDERYRIPGDTVADVCDYPLARNLVLLAVAIASETIMTFALEGVRKDWSATLRDLAIRSLEV